MHKVSRALLSVYDKTGIVDLAERLVETGVEIVSTGGTARTLREAGIDVTDVSEVTGFPEIMEGRVKTLHPLIHGALLGKTDNDEHVGAMEEHGIRPIELVVINLYPFEETVEKPNATHEEIIEQIDIGGPAMLRASAKNYKFVGVVTSPDQYDAVVEELRSNDNSLSETTRLSFARKAFALTSRYDSAISRYLGKQFREEGIKREELPTETANAGLEVREHSQQLSMHYILDQALRYGENPHQNGGLYGHFSTIFSQLHGKELSYNNILDIDAAARLVLEFDEPTVVIVKHTNPCGVGSAATLTEAWEKAFATDTKSPFGGIVAVNRPLDPDAAAAIHKIFTEVIIAPEFPEETLEILRKKKDRRLIRVNYEQLATSFNIPQVRSVAGGVLVQGADNRLLDPDAKRTVSRRAPTPEEERAMLFAWRVAKHVKSNAIVYALEDRTLGIGAGQSSRFDSAMIAASKAGNEGLSLKGCAVASDAFFPFADGLLQAVEAGATAVIQPGGSIRDQEVIDAADQNEIAMIFTGTRHFRH